MACFFELTQLTGLWGIYPCPYRLFDVDDIIVNTLGCMLGWALAGPIVRRLPTLDSIDDRVPVPFGRRLIALLLDATGYAFCLPFFAVAWYLLGGQPLTSAFLVALLVFAVWFGRHELASGVRNVALPPTRTQSAPEVLPEESQNAAPSVL